MKKIFPLVLISIGVAMISVLSQFTLPFGPIPLTLQTLMIGIIGTIYKPSHAFVTVCLYLLLGFLGFPVLAGGASGASHFLGPTAGFLLFFPFRAWITSLFTSANPALSLSFWPISSVVLSSLCQELSALCWSRIPISKKHLLWSLLPLSLPTSSNWSSSLSPARRFLPASNTTGISNKIQRVRTY